MAPHELAGDDDVEIFPHRRRDDQGWAARLPGIYTLLLLMTFIFTSGVSYRKLAETSESLASFVEEVRSNYVRRDVAAEQNRRLEDQIAMLTAEVRYLNEALDRATLVATPPPASGPRFGRK